MLHSTSLQTVSVGSTSQSRQGQSEGVHTHADWSTPASPLWACRVYANSACCTLHSLTPLTSDLSDLPDPSDISDLSDPFIPCCDCSKDKEEKLTTAMPLVKIADAMLDAQ